MIFFLFEFKLQYWSRWINIRFYKIKKSNYSSNIYSLFAITIIYKFINFLINQLE